MPWRGRSFPGEFPTLGYLVQEWIEANLVVPDGNLAGEPFLLTDEQIRFLLFHYRLDPLTGRFVYRGTQLVRSQGWGKDPIGAAMICAEGLGEVLPAGWDAHGEPVARPWPTPWIQVAAVSEDQTGNTWRPIVTMLGDGPLAGLPGLDVGLTRINLPSGGLIEPVSSAAPSRLGARITFAILGETHLWTRASGGHTLAANLKRNLAKMDGRFAEISNAYDPSEDSVAQRTHRAKAADVYLDWRPAPDPTVSLHNRGEFRKALRYCYGDAVKTGQPGNRGWVNLDRIIAEALDPSTSPADARRYFLTLVTVGDRDLVDPVAWDAAGYPDDPLVAGERITLGFDGSKTQDCTALVACRIADGRLFPIRTWERPADAGLDWRVPSGEVDATMARAMDAYDVWYVFCDPYRWTDYLDKWAGLWPRKIVELATNSEARMDAALSRFLTSFRAGELSHDGDPVLTRHIKNSALAKGKRKAPRDADPAPGDDPDSLGAFFLRIVKRKRTARIDTAVAAILAYEARGKAVEDGALLEPEKPKKPRLW
jgi:hypothetical protein